MAEVVEAVSCQYLLVGSSHYTNGQEPQLLTRLSDSAWAGRHGTETQATEIGSSTRGDGCTACRTTVGSGVAGRLLALTLSVGARCAPALSSLISAWMWPVRAAVCSGVLPSCSHVEW